MAAVSRTLGYTRKEFYFDDLIEYIGSFEQKEYFLRKDQGKKIKSRNDVSCPDLIAFSIPDSGVFVRVCFQLLHQTSIFCS